MKINLVAKFHKIHLPVANKLREFRSKKTSTKRLLMCEIINNQSFDHKSIKTLLVLYVRKKE
jgi:hypothetical protein